VTDQTGTANPAMQGTPEFADDDLGRLQGILFGDHARKTNERLDTLEQALLGAIADLKNDLTSKIKDLQKQVDREEATRAKATANLTERVTEEIKTRTSEAKKLQRQLDGSVDKLNGMIEDATSGAQLETESNQRELMRMVEESAADLRDYAVDRRALSALLSTTADELNAPDGD